ncbi:magnesium and cobalt transport protein CorA [Pedobacter sp. HMWF019]|uniref:magnesium/cobalt transporter CorA n=1 Tax=Pedobacter sp. HMWF019 TaxID=2056856 RepID=UPI000D38AF37|nr:magnesium/cobalt transporter CorA [Pedobacter sp. HMWF019]PTT03607.1 magnesium and cobalt transport protein CorA [Pedobacter sp. HMWF019]
MGKRIKSKRKRKHYSLPVVGSSPGQVYIDEHSLEPKVTVHAFNAGEYKIEETNSIEHLSKVLTDKNLTFWVDIRGFKSEAMFETLTRDFNVNKLVLEDITRTYQRPKQEEYDTYVFAVSRMLFFDEENNLENEQISFILTDNAVFTFQEGYENCLDPVRNRLKAGKGNIRVSGSSYIMYAIMDVVIDKYFEILNIWGEDLDQIEDRLIDKPDRSIMYDIQAVKRNLIAIRRVAWPERDKLNDFLRSDSPLITDQTKLYIRDAYDHCIQIIDIVESLKEISASNLDMYLSIISNRMNEIMKVLTIMSSIFIPLTFIAGIYGMNFARQDPVTGKLMPDNMPELYAQHGYLYTMIIMVVIAVVQVIYFWRKGWFK